MNEPFIAWPGWKHVAYAARLTALVGLLFVVVYGGADYLTGLRRDHVRLFVRQELAIPLWPPAILVYDSLYLLFLLAPLVVRERERFRRVALTAAATIGISGVCFLLIPAKLGFDAPVVTGSLSTIFAVSDKINLDYNLVPSLHVALTTLCLAAFWRGATRLVRVGLVVWGAALGLSTLLTHQHHVIDVIAGVVVAFATFRWLDAR